MDSWCFSIHPSTVHRKIFIMKKSIKSIYDVKSKCKLCVWDWFGIKEQMENALFIVFSCHVSRNKWTRRQILIDLFFFKCTHNTMTMMMSSKRLKTCWQLFFTLNCLFIGFASVCVFWQTIHISQLNLLSFIITSKSCR